MTCFDRNTIFGVIKNNPKQAIFLTKCKGNGITTFCRCKFNNENVVYLAEDNNGKITTSNSNFDEYKKIVKSKENTNEILKRIKMICPLVADFLYLLPSSFDLLGIRFLSPGTFFRNLSLDLANSMINLAIEGKLKTFGDFLKMAISKSKIDYIYLIIEHANQLSDNFISEIKAVLKDNEQAHAIFCFDDDCVPAEFKFAFENEFVEYVFGFASFENGGEEILKGENIEITDEIKALYSNSTNYIDFRSKYARLNYRQTEIEQNLLVLIKYISLFDADRMSKNDIELVLEYLITNPNYIDAKFTVNDVIKMMTNSGFLIQDLESDCFRIFKIKTVDKEGDVALIHSFLLYLANKDESQLITYDFFKSLFISSNNLEHFPPYLVAGHILNIVLDIDENFKNTLFAVLKNMTFEYKYWKPIFVALFNNKYFKYIPRCSNMSNNSNFLIKLASSHEYYVPDMQNEIEMLITKCANNDTRVLLYAVLYDYLDTHSQEKCLKLVESLKRDSLLKDSQYYKYLQILLAEKEERWETMNSMFDDSLGRLHKEEICRALNTKLAFSIMRYIDGWEEDQKKSKYISDIARALVSDDYFTINDPFIICNLLTYKYIFGTDLLADYIINYDKMFDRTNITTATHHYLMNKSIYEVLIHNNIRLFNYKMFLSLPNEYNKKSRINALIYNYYVVAHYTNNWSAIRAANKLIKGNAFFKEYRNYEKIAIIKKMNNCDIKKNIKFLIRYGFMVHRTIDIKYLIEELEKEDNL